MRIEFANYCTLHENFVQEGSASFAKGAEGLLTVALPTVGRCAVQGVLPQAEGGLLVVGGGVLGFTPKGVCRLEGVVLCGPLAAEAAAQIEVPRLVQVQSCPDAASALYRLLKGGHSLPPHQASALAYWLVCALAGGAETQQEATPLPPLVATAIGLIQEHYADVYGVEELAGELGVTKSHLIRSFTASLGVSPGKYLTQVRIDTAKRLLLHREYPLDVVASLCGFSGANYLCKVFRRETGQSPSAWRKNETSLALPPPEGNTQLQEWEEQMYL